MSDLFGVAGRELLERLAICEPWRGTVEASLSLIDDLHAEIDLVNRQLRLGGAEHPYIPPLLTVPGIGWVLAFTIGAEIGDRSARRRRGEGRQGRRRGPRAAAGGAPGSAVRRGRTGGRP